jgi:hypothetical protein
MKTYLLILLVGLLLASCSEEKPLETSAAPVPDGTTLVSTTKQQLKDVGDEGEVEILITEEFYKKIANATECNGYKKLVDKADYAALSLLVSKRKYFVRVPAMTIDGPSSFLINVEVLSNGVVYASSSATCISCSKTCCTINVVGGEVFCDGCSGCSVRIRPCL